MTRNFDKKSISYHYDVGNEFYELLLGNNMNYTCAYFKTPNENLDKAQTRKLSLICKKLRLKKGEQFLDVGCGWGSLVIYAAKKYKVKAYGITLSKEQAKYAQERIKKEKLEKFAKVDYLDYRDLKGKYDKISAIGIIEHIGIKNINKFYSIIYKSLKPEGLFLNHGITKSRFWKPNDETDFLIKYVFPNGELDFLPNHIKKIEQFFEVLDIENIRRHYSYTTKVWVENLEKNRDKILKLVPEKTYRIWKLYLAGCVVAFANEKSTIYQLLLSKTKNGKLNYPLTRFDVFK